MHEGIKQLTEKEKQTLRLLLGGYDAKSSARELGLSVHTINERLRDARRKLGVSSSREAARWLRDAEGPAPHRLGDEQFGDALAGPLAELKTPDHGKAAWGRPAWVLAGGVIMSLVLALYALSSFGTLSSVGASAASEAARSSQAEQSARAWLALVDEEDWKGAYAQTGQSFQRNNTVEDWTAAATGVRARYGPTSGRTLISSEWVPAPPNGYRIVKFRSKTSKQGLITETLSLAEEGVAWKVVGIVID
jgi:DNA-binding CsgD family transcriptional regulator